GHSRRLGPLRSGAGSWNDEAVETKKRRFGHGAQSTDSAAGHDALESRLEALHFGLRAHRDANVGGPDGPGAADKNILRGHGGYHFFRRPLGVQHEAV